MEYCRDLISKGDFWSLCVWLIAVCNITQIIECLHFISITKAQIKIWCIFLGKNIKTYMVLIKFYKKISNINSKMVYLDKTILENFKFDLKCFVNSYIF